MNMGSSRTGALLGLAVTVALMPTMGSSVGEDASAHGEHHDHSMHMQMMKAAGDESSYATKLSTYETPDVTLLGQDGQKYSLVALLDSERPVMLNFIFTSCTTICPVMTATFREVERRLGPDREHVQLVSISIDPENDTPTRLAEYAHDRGAGEPWAFLTGDLASIRSTQVAFDAYRGNKMNHVPITFLRASPDEPWLRIDGFAAASDIMREYRGLTTTE
jgi:protein SCO1/2